MVWSGFLPPRRGRPIRPGKPWVTCLRPVPLGRRPVPPGGNEGPGAVAGCRAVARGGIRSADAALRRSVGSDRTPGGRMRVRALALALLGTVATIAVDVSPALAQAPGTAVTVAHSCAATS